MILRIDHVSLAVRDYEKASTFFQKLLGAVPGVGAGDEKLGFYWKIFSLGDLSRLEIIAPTAEKSFLEGFLKERDGGVHHITLQCRDIAEARAHLERHGIPYFGYNEYPGGIWKELFIHPRDAFGVLVQLAEFRPDEWLSSEVRFSGETRWEIKNGRDGITAAFSHPGGGKMEMRLTGEEARRLIDDLRAAL
ncbi:MAG TPA: hypothetical protein ENN21_00040 [Spirochaetes bacterium]|nr:hypothetical protein [Spirochaetota bacterium]